MALYMHAGGKARVFSGPNSAAVRKRLFWEVLMRQFLPFVILVWAAFLVSGCDTLDNIFQDHYSSHAPTETDVIKRPWFERDQPTNMEPVYCYKTLVELECFDHPRAGDARPAVWTFKAVEK